MGNKAGVPVKVFVATIMRNYNKGGNQSDAARQMGITPAAVSLRLKYLRSLGVKMPPRKNRDRIKAEAMAELKRWK